MAGTTGAIIGSAAIGGLTGLANGTNGTSESSSIGYGGSSNWSTSSSSAESASQSHVFGSEASEKDILRAAEANELQHQYWLEQAAFNSAEAKANRLWQEQMSNTAYQRAVKDLQKAGLNPILAAANMGASTGTGAQATTGIQTAYKANTYADEDSSSWSKSQSKSESSGSSSEYSESSGQSKTETQAKSIIDGVKNYFTGGATAATKIKDKVTKALNSKNGGGGGHSIKK